MAKFAEGTTVSSEQSLAEIKRTIMRYGAVGFSYMENAKAAAVSFDCDGRRIRFVVMLPDRTAREFTHFKTVHNAKVDKPRDPDKVFAAWEQATRQRWRALALVIKAKLEAVDSGIASFHEEFLPYIVLPNGKTVSEWALPQIDHAYETGSMPALLPEGLN